MYLHLYESESAFTNDYNGEYYHEPWVSYTYTESEPRVDYNKPDPYNGHEYVDLGLPSGTKWATMNVGARTPVEYGGYYAWAETEEKERYSYENYKWFGPEERTKYNMTDGMYTVQHQDDAASVNMGGAWHTPTKFQCAELFSCCEFEWVTVSGVSGCMFTSLVNGNKLFFPSAGYKICINETDYLYYEGEWFGIWSSNVYIGNYYNEDSELTDAATITWEFETGNLSWGLNGDSTMEFFPDYHGGIGMYYDSTAKYVAGSMHQGLSVRGVVGNEINMASSGFVTAITATFDGGDTYKKYTYSHYDSDYDHPYVWTDGQEEVGSRNRNPIYVDQNDAVFNYSLDFDGVISMIHIEGMEDTPS